MYRNATVHSKGPLLAGLMEPPGWDASVTGDGEWGVPKLTVKPEREASSYVKVWGAHKNDEHGGPEAGMELGLLTLKGLIVPQTESE